MTTKETKQQEHQRGIIIEHVQEHALFYEAQEKEPYAVIWDDETFWAAEPHELVKPIVAHEKKIAAAKGGEA